MKCDKIVDFASKKLRSHFGNNEKYLEIYQKPGEILEKSRNFGKLGTLHCSVCEVSWCTFVKGVAIVFV